MAQRLFPRLVLTVLILSLFLIACRSEALLDVSAERLVAVEDLPLPDHWKLEAHTRFSPPGTKAEEAWIRRWHPSGASVGIGLTVSAYRFSSERLAKREFRQELRYHTKYGCREIQNSRMASPGTAADQYVILRCDPSMGLMLAKARYKNVLIDVGFDKGEGLTFEDGPELFAIVDAHVQEVLSEAQ